MARLAGVAAGWLAGWWLLWHLDGLPASDRTLPRRRRSIVIPARNEARSLPTLLDSIAGLRSGQSPGLAGTRSEQTRDPADQVVVVDDSSSDGTAGVAAGRGVTVVEAGPPPPGWTGKAWACHTGAGVSGACDTPTGAGDTEVLVFLDADVCLEPGALDRLDSIQARVGGLVSVAPWHRCERGIESFSAFFNIVALMGVGAFTALPRSRSAAGAFGPVLVCDRSDYVAVGGHASVRGDVLDDVALAGRFRAAGLGVRCWAGREAVSYRMYPEGFHQLVEGWTKNIAKGAGAATRPVTLVLSMLWITALVSVVIGLAGADDRIPWLVAYVAIGAQLVWMLRRAGRFRWWTWALWPAPLGVFVAVFVRSLALVAFRRPVSWKGRRIPTARP